MPGQGAILSCRVGWDLLIPCQRDKETLLSLPWGCSWLECDWGKPAWLADCEKAISDGSGIKAFSMG